jgi:hypothetical protein
MIVDPECLDYFNEAHLEDCLIDFLKNYYSNEPIIAQVLKTLILMLATTVTSDADTMSGKVFLDRDGLKLLLTLLDE